MKKINLIHWVFLMAVFATLQNCNPKEKKPGTVIVTPVADTTKPIDTTIYEDGVAPVSDATARKPEKEKKEKVICSFGHKKLNTKKRDIAEAPGGQRGKPPKKPRVEDPPPPPDEPPPPPPDEPPPAGTNVIYINFFGKTVSGTMWNAGSFTVGHSGLAQSEMEYIKTQTAAGLLEFNVLVTYDEAIFNATPEGHKIEVIVTEDWQWFGSAGGVAYINSFFWTDATPAFVFSTLLNYNSHSIAEAIRHEASHTLALRHQSVCDANGVVITQYRPGWTMGVSYYVDLGIFGTGTSSLQCAIQDDRAKLISAVGLK